VFDTWKVPYVSVVDSVVRAGKLGDHFDVIVLPDQSPHELFDGLPRQYPAPYAGGLGTAGVEALRQFVTDGGTLVALNDASRFAVERLLLPCATSSKAWPTTNFTLRVDLPARAGPERCDRARHARPVGGLV